MPSAAAVGSKCLGWRHSTVSKRTRVSLSETLMILWLCMWPLSCFHLIQIFDFLAHQFGASGLRWLKKQPPSDNIPCEYIGATQQLPSGLNQIAFFSSAGHKKCCNRSIPVVRYQGRPAEKSLCGSYEDGDHSWLCCTLKCADVEFPLGGGKTDKSNVPPLSNT